MNDPFGAFCRHGQVEMPGSGRGDLAGLTFAVKDVFDLAGAVTGAGNPDWLRTHKPADRTAPAVQAILDAGARLIGKTQTDELAFSLSGRNVHYGTPVNPRAAGRIPGGSSSGSAVAVAGKLVDFALGTDCGGSVRLPASYCGIVGFRPSHGRIPLDGLVPLAPSFDTVGWFARSGEVTERVGRVLLADQGGDAKLGRLIYATDLLELGPGPAAAALAQPAAAVAEHFARSEERAILAGLDLDPVHMFRVLQGAEAWSAHGSWIEEVEPDLASDVRARFLWGSKVRPQEVALAKRQRDQVAEQLAAILGDDGVICLPSAPGAAPEVDAAPEALDEVRWRSIRLLSMAGLARLPQVSLPLAVVDGCPLGLSLIAPRGADIALLAFARAILAGGRAGSGQTGSTPWT